MKKLNVFLATMFFVLIFSSTTAAQEKSSFLGKWNVNVVGTPGGDSKMIIDLIEKEGKLTGSAINPVDNKELFAFTKVEEEADKVTVYFTSQGYDVYMYLEKKDIDNLEGSMMDMFDATATRIKS